MRIGIPSYMVVALFSLTVVGCGEGGGGGPPAPTDQCLGATDQEALRAIAVFDAGLFDAGVQDGGGLDAGSADGGGADAGISHEAVRNLVIACILSQDCVDELIQGTQADVDACLAPCIDATPFADLSQGCADCYFQDMNCALVHCANLCLGSDPASCLACAEENCAPSRVLCTGID